MKLIYITIITLLYSCHTSENPSLSKLNNTIFISAEPNEESVEFAAILDSVIVTPLEFTEESALSWIKKVRIRRNRIFVMDETLKEIVVFDLAGTFLQKFNSYGKGAGEVVSASDMEIDVNREFLLVSSGSTKSISRYKL